MKKIVLAGVAAAALISSNAMADVTASATASWDASATKDTTSALVVTPHEIPEFPVRGRD